MNSANLEQRCRHAASFNASKLMEPLRPTEKRNRVAGLQLLGEEFLHQLHQWTHHAIHWRFQGCGLWEGNEMTLQFALSLYAIE
jgi:hypothetical protein